MHDILRNMDVRRFGTLHPALAETIRGLLPRLEQISGERKILLGEAAGFIAARERSAQDAPLIFICTHNSRRSHMSQIWAQTFAWLYGLDHVTCYSGGTEATAFHPHAVRALGECGFHIPTPGDQPNPRYEVSWSTLAPPLEAWSKSFDDQHNPSSDFAAVMTCSDADEACPIVPGADARFPIRYDDPKIADGTPAEAEVYLTRCLQIAAEMLFLMKEVNHGNE